MDSALNFIKQSVLVALIIYVIFAGLMAVLGVLSWVSWDFVGEWLSRVGLVTLLLATLTSLVTVLTGLLRK